VGFAVGGGDRCGDSLGAARSPCGGDSPGHLEGRRRRRGGLRCVGAELEASLGLCQEVVADVLDAQLVRLGEEAGLALGDELAAVEP
jgi:hypothetical protein